MATKLDLAFWTLWLASIVRHDSNWGTVYLGMSIIVLLFSIWISWRRS